MKQAEILLIEDNPADVMLTQHAFNSAKLLNNLHVVNDGESALKFLKKQDEYSDAPTPHLILMDLNVPKVNGHEMLEQIKQTEILKRIPIIIMSGSQAQSDVAKSYDLHANCYITKPIDLNKLSLVASTLDNYWFSLVTLPPKDE